MIYSMEQTPKLQAPGAGLPLVQRIFLKLWLGPVTSKKTPASDTRKLYESINIKIIEKVSKIPTEKRNTKILISPVHGLEDSSRFWSLNGTLEHLLIVGKGLEGIILSLAAGKVPPTVIDIAQVKPSHPHQSYLEEFQSYAPGLLTRIDAGLKKPGMNIDSTLTHLHPWFGPFTAKQWYWLLAAHQGLHYTQIKKIIRGL